MTRYCPALTTTHTSSPRPSPPCASDFALKLFRFRFRFISIVRTVHGAHGVQRRSVKTQPIFLELFANDYFKLLTLNESTRSSPAGSNAVWPPFLKTVVSLHLFRTFSIFCTIEVYSQDVQTMYRIKRKLANQRC